MVLGIDIGGTNIKFAVVNEKYEILLKHEISTCAERNINEIIQGIIETCKEIKENVSFDLIGIGTPGVLDDERKRCLVAGNIPYHNTPIVQMIEESLGIPVCLENDGNCAVYGELYAGSGKNLKNFVMVTLGTGIGGGIVLDGKLYNGSFGNAGEIGHMVIVHDGVPCVCGQRGCWEHYASVTALIHQSQKEAEKNPGSILAEMCNGEVNGRTVFDAVRKGCPIAKRVLTEYSDYIMSGLCGLYRIFLPDAIVLGGGITNEEELLISNLKQEMLKETKLMVSTLRNDAGVIGAAAMARMKFNNQK